MRYAIDHGFLILMPNAPSPTELAECLSAVAQSQDRASFIVLFEYYAPKLKTYFRQFGFPSSAADDLMQETMLRLWSKAHQFDQTKGQASAWVFTVARNLCFTRLRSLRFEPILDDLTEITDPASGSESVLAASELETRLREVLERLSEEQASLLKASFFEGKTHLEIARERNLPLGTVKAHLRRTLLKLRKALSEIS